MLREIIIPFYREREREDGIITSRELTEMNTQEQPNFNEPDNLKNSTKKQVNFLKILDLRQFLSIRRL